MMLILIKANHYMLSSSSLKRSAFIFEEIVNQAKYSIPVVNSKSDCFMVHSRKLTYVHLYFPKNGGSDRILSFWNRPIFRGYVGFREATPSHHTALLRVGPFLARCDVAIAPIGDEVVVLPSCVGAARSKCCEIQMIKSNEQLNILYLYNNIMCVYTQVYHIYILYAILSNQFENTPNFGLYSPWRPFFASQIFSAPHGPVVTICFTGLQKNKQSDHSGGVDLLRLVGASQN